MREQGRKEETKEEKGRKGNKGREEERRRKKEWERKNFVYPLDYHWGSVYLSDIYTDLSVVRSNAKILKPPGDKKILQKCDLEKCKMYKNNKGHREKEFTWKVRQYSENCMESPGNNF